MENFLEKRAIEEITNEYSIIPDLKINSQGKLYMISKDEIKELNQNRSPDFMDSLILTFAENVAKQDNNVYQKEVYLNKKSNKSF